MLGSVLFLGNMNVIRGKKKMWLYLFIDQHIIIYYEVVMEISYHIIIWSGIR